MSARHGIETTYKGVLFRSRLEARHAAFFDNIGWRWEYEPFDADGYIPDFAILGNAPLLVEVKPDTTLKELEQYTPRIERAVHDSWEHDFLIVGATPFPAINVRTSWEGGLLAYGILGEFMDAYVEPTGAESSPAGYSTGAGLWHICETCGAAAVIHDYQSYHCRPCGHSNHHGPNLAGSDRPLARSWATAVNTVRWAGNDA